MQSEPTAVFDRSPSVDPSSEAFLEITQHGHDLHGEHRVSGPPPHEPEHSGLRRDSPEAGEQPPLDEPTATEPAQWIDPVSQYENEIAKSSWRPKASPRVAQPAIYTGVSLEAFPNEVLTHILSHLPPPSLSSMALVSRRLHSLVTTPHAWRVAFSRYFPGPYTVEDGAWTVNPSDSVTSDRRYFSRLTALASWRSEYILRTRLLRSLSRGKPAQFEPSKKTGTVRSASVANGSAVVTYTSQLMYPVSHLHGAFGTEVSKKEPLFIHGASEQGIASASDPSSVKVGTWGLSDHQLFRHFADLFPGDAEYGLGSGELVGAPNRMDVSQPYGMIYGEACPQGRSYFISTTEQRGRFLNLAASTSQPHLGIPALNMIGTGITAVWIAKFSNVLKMTGGLVAMLSGSSTGVLTAYALGPHPTYEKRYERGQVTAKWVLCPGVPIIAIAVDDSYSPKRHARRRIWATVLNALGEVFYLSDMPRQPDVPSTKLTPEEYDHLAWKTGRSVRWELVELSRRTARPDPFNRDLVDGSYSPRSSSDSMKLSEEQIAAETREIECFLSFRPKHFRKACEGWNMRRELKVDFAGDDGHGAGESAIVICPGIGEDEQASIRRYTRKVSKHDLPSSNPIRPSQNTDSVPPSSIFGGPAKLPVDSAEDTPSSRASSRISETVCSISNTEWRITDFNFGDRKSIEITTSALDISTYALVTTDEDPLIGMSGSSASSSATSSPLPHMKQPPGSPEVPGQRGRYLAVGTAAGMVLVWDIRSPTSKTSELINSVAPVRLIQTESPQVSCVALTSLYLVHGGNDGLVQAWDPLASSTRPIRTINSRFSTRARRRLVQAEASIHGVGNNFYATGAISLDPDPTVLRGMVALGTHLRYWSYSSSAADQYKSSKRRLRRGPRGGNAVTEGQRFNTSGRGALTDYIEDEKVEMQRQEVADRKKRAHLSHRFGVDLLGPDIDEDQLLAYARLLSEESYTSEASKRTDHLYSSSIAMRSTSPSDNDNDTDTVGPNDSSFAPDELSSASSPYEDLADDLEPEIAEAIRLSLLDEAQAPDTGADSFDLFPSHFHPHSSPPSPSKSTPPVAESSNQQEIDDLEFAIQLSLAEAESQSQSHAFEEFPALQASPGKKDSDKGKGKRRAL
ncbi:F-box and WD domain protein [Aspergillus heteromorphus CBS 117.55]|uniref:F-box and WD domain protein n=1 Tax=Aspergillus heteromorphus CBS 117.55 TaxID=1448321 RepID=A0A317UXY6_9EURO|nr:F-box and WD domain protein [Aspergillus heteromorphus CBS 117.55]PWY66456.1 F-box and WD domain protein [Aspergillus heteromorphus CBS 117.55]